MDWRFLDSGRAGAALLAVLVSLGLLLQPHRSAASEPRIQAIRIEPAVLELEPNETLNLTVFAIYDDDSEKEVTGEATFESRDEEVVQVTGRTAKGIGAGETVIRALHPPSGEDAEAEVSVLGITELLIQPGDATVAVGGTVQVRALATLENGRTGVDVTALVEWESGKREVATVDPVVRGLIHGLKVGDAEIEASDNASGVKSPDGGAFVHVTPGGGGGGPGAEIKRMWTEATELSLLTGETAQLQVKAELEDGGEVDVTGDVSFASTRPQVASVDTAGKVTAQGPGTAEIRIEHPSGVDVDEDPAIWVGELEQLHLSPATRTLAVGQSLALKALGGFDNGRSLDLTDEVSWSSDDDDVLTVSNSPGTRGRVTGIQSGDTSVTARHRESGVESRRSDGEFTVFGAGGPVEPGEDEDVRDLVFEPAVLRLRPGETRALRVFAVFERGGTRDVSDRVQLTVRDPNVAAIELGTEVTGLKGGQTEVIASDPISRVRSRVRAQIEVTRLVALRIDPVQASLPAGTPRQFRARADFDDGSTGIDVTSLVTWKSEQPNVATVDNGSAKGLVTALVPGAAQIRVEDPVTRLRSDRSTGRVLVGGVGVPPSADIVELAFEPAHLVMARGEVRSVAVFGVHPDGSKEAIPLSNLSLRSQDRRYVTITGDNAIFGRSGGVADVLAQHSETGAQGRLPVTVREVTQLSIEPPSLSLRVGDTFDLSALARFNDGTDPVPLSTDVYWRSDASNIAEVVAVGGKGRVTAIEPGLAFIQARHGPSRVRSDASTGQVQVVEELIRILLEPKSIVLEVGGTVRFTAIGQFADGGILDISDDVVWSVSNRDAARIDASGKLQALADGEVLVDAIDLRTGLSAAATGGGARVDVGADLVGLAVSTGDDLPPQPVQVRLQPGEAIQLFGIGLFEGGGETVDLSDRVTWETSDALIVTVEPGGRATCLADGTATISIKDPATTLDSSDTLGDATVECGGEIGVLQVEPQIDPDGTLAIDFPKSRQLRAYRVFADGSRVEVTRNVEWTSSDPNVVAIVAAGGDAGTATALDDGRVVVSVVDPVFGISSNDPGGKNVNVTVRKTRVLLEIFDIKGGTNFVGRVGEVIAFRAKVTYLSPDTTQGVNLRVEWTSSDPDVLLMGSAAGLAVNQGRALTTGQTSITARFPADEITLSPELTATIQFQVLP
jgi:uncharacterized protein YjdB